MTSTLPVPPTVEPAHPPAGSPAARHRFRRPAVLRGPVDDAPWVRPALLALLVLTGVLYI